MDEAEKNLIKELDDGNLKLNFSLKNEVSIKVGGPADYFYEANRIDDLVKAVSSAYKYKKPYFILGGGYNIVPSDSGFPGLIIKNNTSNIAFSDDNSQVIVDSGVNLGKLINLAASRGLGGLEFLFGVPGTIGGAVYGNAGAFNYEISDFVKSIILLRPANGEMKVVKRGKEWMNFSYRSSHLKEENALEKDKFKPVILTVKLQLVKRRRDEILDLMQTNLKQKKQGQPLDEISAGSFFKNPGPTEKNQSAGYLLDSCGAKKLRIGGAGFSKKHANFLINRKNATASDIRRLAEKAKNIVFDKSKINLEEEIEYIGKW